MDMDVDRKSEMNLSCKELRMLLPDEFRLSHKAMEATSNIYSTIGENVFTIRTAQHWFKNGSLELDDLPRSKKAPRGGFGYFEAVRRRRS